MAALFLVAGLAAHPSGAESAPVLARVEADQPRLAFGLPAYANLAGADGRAYLVVHATESDLARAGFAFRVLDTGHAPNEYLLALPRRSDAVTAAAGRFAVVHDDGVQWIIRAGPEDAAALSDLGFEVMRLGPHPIRRPDAVPAAPGPEPAAFVASPLVAELVAAMRTEDLTGQLRRVTGDDATIAGGRYVALTSRHTTSATLRPATATAFEHFESLGLAVRYQPWSSGSYTGVNVVAEQPGEGPSTGVVFMIAHLDNMPSSGRAPGADDNGSGSAALMRTAAILRGARFERMLRYILYTGEEQGLLGSHATAGEFASDPVTGVINLDMIAWDSKGGPTMRIHTRRTNEPAGYAADLALVSAFTNSVAAYGLSGSLQPIVTPDHIWASDHSSFWDQNQPAVLVIEDDTSDFNSYYHTANDTVARVNLPYFTAMARASLAAAAHLAGPLGRRPFDLVRVVSDHGATDDSTGPGVFDARHEAGAEESGPDGRDAEAAHPVGVPAWFGLRSDPYGKPLRLDVRPPESDTIFLGRLTAFTANGSLFAASNRLRFSFPSPPAPDRVYSARVRLYAPFLGQSNDYVVVADLRDLVGTGGALALPPVSGVSSNTVYGTCEIASRRLDTAPPSLAPALPTEGGTPVVDLPGQPGARVIDTLEATLEIEAPGGGWAFLVAFTNEPSVSDATFDTGRDVIRLSPNLSGLSAATGVFLRVLRSWPAP